MLKPTVGFKVAVVRSGPNLDLLGPPSNPRSAKWLNVNEDPIPLETHNLVYDSYFE